MFFSKICPPTYPGSVNLIFQRSFIQLRLQFNTEAELEIYRPNKEVDVSLLILSVWHLHQGA